MAWYDELPWGDIFKGVIGGTGAYMGYQAGQPQTQTTQTQMSPQMQGQWDAYTNFANQLANKPYQSGVAPMSQDQYSAMDQIRGLAGGGAEMNAGSNALQGFLSGSYRNPFAGENPYLKGLIQNTNDEVQNRMGTAAFSSGSFGNSGVAQQTAKGLSDSTNNLQYQNYLNSSNIAENQLNRMANLVPQGLAYQQQRLGNASAQLQSGAMQQTQGQNLLNDYLNYPSKQLGFMGQPLGLGQGSTTTTSIPGNSGASALGGGLLGLQLANAFSGQTPPPPYTYPNFTTGSYNWGGGL